MQNIVAGKEKRKIPYLDTLAFLVLLITFFGYIGIKMGISNMFSTIMATAYQLLVDTVLYIMAIAVLAGAFGKLATEFGLVKILNKIFSPLMRPLYSLPGVASLGIITTYLSDNPAIISLAKDDEYISYFEEYETPCLCNLGTAFGMGLIVTTFMIGLGYFKEAVVGNLGAIIGSIVSVRIMAYRTRKAMGVSKATVEKNSYKRDLSDTLIERSEGSFFERFLTAFLEGGKLGVDIGLSIIPGVLVICTIIMILTFGPLDPSIGYQGEAFEGVGLLPKIGELIAPASKVLFGFERPEAIAFPITALGAVGAALSLVPNFLKNGIIGSNEIAVFTAMGMCWSGFLSTHVAMLDALGHRKLIGKAIGSHTIGGIIAGISAHYILVLINSLSKLF
ncbi:hypothetical protein [Proteiniborus sp. MB09-C3]|uniref:CD0519/CD1768 family membrane protein n=1 Tax=Proteiniborus sp. MB09-C3 TaxID=3050072 RepID=UPI002555579B|nr:hypothetical protein [Proteiniborus sp. MB09-C3]WIV11274.1 hypothetical protein QO263_14090 [Proteiniborus sp. MB09-C3]